MKKFSYVSIVTATLLATSLMTARVLAQEGEPCEDRVTGGGYIIIPGEKGGDDIFANFGAGGGIHQGELWGYVTYLDHRSSPPLKVNAQEVTAYCQVGCAPTEGCECRRITYTNATVRVGSEKLEGVVVIVEVCDCSEPGTDDTFSICIPSIGYCQGGVLGGDDKPSGGNIQLHRPEAGECNPPPICENLEELCPCFRTCF